MNSQVKAAAMRKTVAVNTDLELAFHLADLADTITLRWWSPNGVASTAKADGSPVTEADVAAEKALLNAVRNACPGDGFLGEEVGEKQGTTGRRWIVDGIDGTRSFVAGQPEWGTLIALERGNGINLGISSSPVQERRWWAARGAGAFSGHPKDGFSGTRLQVSTERGLNPDRFITLPSFGDLSANQRRTVRGLSGGNPPDRPWSHQNRIAEGEADVCVWFCGGIWDHAAPSILVEEAGGRFSDHQGGKCLAARAAIYSNGLRHDEVLAALAAS